MAGELLIVAGMRRLILFLILLGLSRSPLGAMALQSQTGVNPHGIVESVAVSGVDEDAISEDVRNAVHRLQGKPFDQNEADALVARIQAEQSTWTATVRLTEGNDSNRVKVLFVIEETNGQPGGQSNINSRYTVERVDVQGFDESKLSKTVRDEIQQLVGEKLDQEKAGQILGDINRELQPKYSAVKKVMKGSDPQHIVVIYDIHKARLIPFLDIPANQFVYNSKQNFSFDADIGFGKINRFYFGGYDDQDQLIERFAGFNLGVESTKVGTDHLGIALRYGRFHERWQPSTVLADTGAIYRDRNSFNPSVTFAFDARLRVIAGVDLSELQLQYPEVHRANSGAAVASVVFHNIWSKTDRYSTRSKPVTSFITAIANSIVITFINGTSLMPNMCLHTTKTDCSCRFWPERFPEMRRCMNAFRWGTPRLCEAGINSISRRPAEIEWFMRPCSMDSGSRKSETSISTGTGANTSDTSGLASICSTTWAPWAMPDFRCRRGTPLDLASARRMHLRFLSN